jgi:hypothetical protein
MTVKASGRSALMLTAGLLVCFAGPSLAAGADDTTPTWKSNTAGPPVEVSAKEVSAKEGSAKHASHHAHRKSSNVAAKSSDKKAATTDDAASHEGGGISPPISPSVANANAQLTSADTPISQARAMSARASDILQASPGKPADAQPAADTQVVSADQINDVDRALHESPPPLPTLAMVTAEAPATPAAPVLAKSGESSTWEHTSLIGKIFIGFGTLLTMASAARMFIA